MEPVHLTCNEPLGMVTHSLAETLAGRKGFICPIGIVGEHLQVLYLRVLQHFLQTVETPVAKGVSAIVIMLLEIGGINVYEATVAIFQAALCEGRSVVEREGVKLYSQRLFQILAVKHDEAIELHLVGDAPVAAVEVKAAVMAQCLDVVEHLGVVLVEEVVVAAVELEEIGGLYAFLMLYLRHI